MLDAFRSGEIHILLGTQMIAKGLDFPNVTLVGVVNADVGLHLPTSARRSGRSNCSPRSPGRTGRGAQRRHVFVQTFQPEHPCIALAAITIT